MIRRGFVHRTGPGNTVGMKRSRTPQRHLCAPCGLEQRGPARFFLAGLITAFILAWSGCSTLHVPAVRPGFSERESVEVETDGIVLRARPIVGRESYSELFDDDLPQIGIVAVWTTVENHSEQAAAVNPEQWYLMAESRRCPAMSVNKMVDRYYHERGIRLYVVQADERTRERLQKFSLQREELAPGAAAEGFMFFRMEGSAHAPWNLDATLMAKGIKLGGAHKLDMQLPLHAHP